MIHNLLKWKATKRAERIANFIIPWLKNDWNVLDFGAGNMKIAETIHKKIGVKISGVDVLDDNTTNLPFSLYDGNKIPFPNNSFDALCAISVFHHTTNAEELIDECLRVTKKRLIVHEDIYSNYLELQWIKAWDYIFNKIVSPSMSFPFHFKKTNEWEKIFSLHPKVKSVKSFPVTPDPLRPTRHRLFIIDLNEQNHY